MEKRAKVTRRHFLYLSTAAMGSVVVAACGGNTANKPTGTQTPQRSAPETPATSAPVITPTGPRQPAQGGATQTIPSTPGNMAGNTAQTSSTRVPAPTLPVPKQFNEAPMLSDMVSSGKLPKLDERLPKTPMVLQPVERVGVYGGTWHRELGAARPGLIYRAIGYENLVRWVPDMKDFSADEIMPDIAESYEIGKDGAEYTFKLREGMKWSDGKPFTADDIVFWYEDVVMNDDLTPSFPGWLMAAGKPGTVEKQDDYTLMFKFAGPNGLFLQNMATSSNGWLPVNYPAHYMKQFHKKYNPKVVQEARKQNMDSWTDLFGLKSGGYVGMGNADKPVLFAWKLTESLGANATRVVAERNPYYWKVDPEGNQLPYMDKVAFKLVQNVNVMVLDGANGEIDMQSVGLASLQNKPVLYKNRDKGNYKFFETLPTVPNNADILLNLTHKDENKRKVFRNKDFRIGLSYAINRQEMNNVVYAGQSEPFQDAPRPESRFYHEKLARQYTEYDVKKANQHLDKALPKKDSKGRRLGIDGKPFSFTVEFAPEEAADYGGSDALELIKRYWSAVGIDIAIKPEKRDLLFTRAAGNEHDALERAGGGGLDVLLFPTPYFPFGPGSRYAIPWANWYIHGGLHGKVDVTKADYPVEEPPEAAKQQMRLYDKLKTKVDAEDQAKLMKQILDIAADQFYIIGTTLAPHGFGIVKNNFHNVPKGMVRAWPYPTPAPTNPPQYFMEK